MKARSIKEDIKHLKPRSEEEVQQQIKLDNESVIKKRVRSILLQLDEDQQKELLKNFPHKSIENFSEKEIKKLHTTFVDLQWSGKPILQGKDIRDVHIYPYQPYNESIKHLPGRPKEDFYLIDEITKDDDGTYSFTQHNDRITDLVKKLIREISDNEIARFMAFTFQDIIDDIPEWYYDKDQFKLMYSNRRNQLDDINLRIKRKIESTAPHWMGRYSDRAMRRMM